MTAITSIDSANCGDTVRPQGFHNKTLVLDLGTDTGWACLAGGQLLKSGTIQLATDDELEVQRREGKERTLDVRFVRLYQFLNQHLADGVTRVVFEDVEFASTRMQSQLWASLRSAIWAAALLHPQLNVCVLPVATLKHFATGNGHVRKPQMAEALAVRQPQDYTLVNEGKLQKSDGNLADHNEVDALWLAYFTLAVDRGEQSFLGVHERKKIEAAERREQKARRREKAKQKKAAEIAHQKAKKQAVRSLLKSLGPCCGVFRRQERNLAVCPKCGRRVALPKIRVPSAAGDQESVHPVSTPVPQQRCPSPPPVDVPQLPHQEPQPSH